jgi:hypothetical protein
MRKSHYAIFSFTTVLSVQDEAVRSQVGINPILLLDEGFVIFGPSLGPKLVGINAPDILRPSAGIKT